MPGIVSTLKGIISGKGPELVKAVGDGLDGLFTSKEEKAILDNKRVEIDNLLTEKIMTHEENMENLVIKKTEIYLADTQDARANNTKIQESEKASWLMKNILPLLTIVVTLGFFALLGYMLKYEVPKSNERIMDILLGSLGTAWITMITFFFGSSHSSNEKNKTITAMVNGRN